MSDENTDIRGEFYADLIREDEKVLHYEGAVKLAIYLTLITVTAGVILALLFYYIAIPVDGACRVISPITERVFRLLLFAFPVLVFLMFLNYLYLARNDLDRELVAYHHIALAVRSLSSDNDTKYHISQAKSHLQHASPYHISGSLKWSIVNSLDALSKKDYNDSDIQKSIEDLCELIYNHKNHGIDKKAQDLEDSVSNKATPLDGVRVVLFQPLLDKRKSFLVLAVAAGAGFIIYNILNLSAGLAVFSGVLAIYTIFK